MDGLRKSGVLLWEGSHRRKNGSAFPVEVNIRYVRRDRDYIIAVVRDITQRKQAEEASQRREWFLSQSQRIAHLGNWMVNLETGEVAWSDELYRIYGLSPDGAVPTVDAFIGLIHPDDRSAMRSWMDSAAFPEAPASHGFRMIRPDGTIREIEGYAEVRAAGNEPALLMGTGQGSTFHFTASFAVADVPAVAAAADAVALRILLVDDNRVNELMARRLLEKRGHTVVPAINGREALHHPG